MKKTTTLKALVLSMIMTLGLVMPMMAQTDNFFKSNNEDIYENRDGEGTSITGNNITNQQFGQTVPVGSGLLIMVAAGAGYAVARRRRSMRKAGTMLLALAMILTFTQCKKRIENVTPNNQGSHYITLTVDNPSKVGVNENGAVTFEDGDRIIVLSGGDLTGILEYKNNSFSGKLGAGDDCVDPVPGEPLYFLFTGNNMPGSGAIIDISDQSGDMAVISFGESTTPYSTSISDYSSVLENKCALVKFTLTNATPDPVMIDLVTRVRLTAGDEGFGIEPVENSIGFVSLKNLGNNKERWAVIPPQTQATTGRALVGRKYYASAATIPAVKENELCDTGAIDNVETPTSTLDPYFSIGKGKIVYIASGNLQYQPSTELWRFAEHQYDYVGGTENPGTPSAKPWGNVDGSSNNNIAETTYLGWIDLFGWGTGNNPTKHDIDNSNVPTYNSYVEWGQNIDDGEWYTLDDDEWDYLLDQNENIPIRHGKNGPAIVHGVGGFVILPDVFDCPSYTLTVDSVGQYYYHNRMDRYWKNVYDDDTWARMESYGAVFLPAPGGRNGTDFGMGTTPYSFIPNTNPKEYAGAMTCYWSSSNESAFCAYGYNYKNAMYMDKVNHYKGMAVRLVHDVTFPTSK